MRWRWIDFHLQVVHALILEEVQPLTTHSVVDIATLPVHEDVILINNQFADAQDRYFDLHVSELDGDLLSIDFPRDLYRSEVL